MKKSEITRLAEAVDLQRGERAVFELRGRSYRADCVVPEMARLATDIETERYRAEFNGHWRKKTDFHDVDAGKAIVMVRITAKFEGSEWSGKGFKVTDIVDYAPGLGDSKMMLVRLNDIKACINEHVTVETALNCRARATRERIAQKERIVAQKEAALANARDLAQSNAKRIAALKDQLALPIGDIGITYLRSVDTSGYQEITPTLLAALLDLVETHAINQ